ncbi:TPA: hypothetical protein ACKQCJ_000360 [Stenotrophomonas maltophilia]
MTAPNLIIESWELLSTHPALLPMLVAVIGATFKLAQWRSAEEIKILKARLDQSNESLKSALSDNLEKNKVIEKYKDADRRRRELKQLESNRAMAADIMSRNKTPVSLRDLIGDRHVYRTARSPPPKID